MCTFLDVTSLGSQKLRKRKSCTEFCGERGSECVTWWDHQKFQRSTKSPTGVHTFPKHLMYGILWYAYLHLWWKTNHWFKHIFQSHGAYGFCLMNSGCGIKPIRAPAYTGTSPLRRRSNTHLFGWFKSWFYLDMKPKIVKRWKWWKSKWNYFSVLEHYDDILCKPTIPT